LKRGGNKPAAATSDKEPSARMFMGNLSWNIDEQGIRDFFKDCGTLNDIYWAEDRETGKWRGFVFITFDDVEMAKKAMELNGTSLMDREVRLDYTEPRPQRGGKGGGKSRGRKTELSEKPEGCTTVFVGGLTDDVDDDKITSLATEAGCGEIKAIRWLTDRDTGNFKGCGFVEFYTTECVDAFVKKNGCEFMGRNLRLDYSAPRKKAW
jgi:nucleolin